MLKTKGLLPLSTTTNKLSILSRLTGYIRDKSALSFGPLDREKKILDIGKSLNNFILIIDLLNLNFRKAKIKKRKNCFCIQ